jgi:hypothetical protein
VFECLSGGVVWCGVVWCGVVWCGVVWCGGGCGVVCGVVVWWCDCVVRLHCVITICDLRCVIVL